MKPNYSQLNPFAWTLQQERATEIIWWNSTDKAHPEVALSEKVPEQNTAVHFEYLISETDFLRFIQVACYP